MPSFNRVTAVGNLTRDPKELKEFPSGSKVTDFGLAINEPPKKDGTQDVTWLEIVLWGKSAEVACKYLRKGDPVLIDGRLKYESWEKDGQKRSTLKVVGERMQMLGGKKREATGSPEPVNEVDGGEAITASDATVDDEVPF